MKILSGVSQCYMNDGEPVKCCHCGGENFQGEVSEIVSGNIAEEYTRCCGCGKILSFGLMEVMNHNLTLFTIRTGL
ncbi:hypothetical protein EAMBIBNC_00083 [Citrobacter phage BSwM KMM4]|nr:hypothetical protein EAMBIBNC_00083 [Citrobacter phage BSwM KMM4]